MVAGTDDLADRRRLLLEVEPLLRRIRRIAGPVDDRELEPVGERPHRLPRRRAVADAPVHQDDPRPAADRLDVEVEHGPHDNGCTKLAEKWPFLWRNGGFAVSQALICSRRWSPLRERRSSPPGPARYSGA